ncbi:MAG: HAD-IA family hydrolase [Hyphomonadaceae bacterium]|nr:HAD-IA family hydrolase [Hyphomonadaceae bacterium]
MSDLDQALLRDATLVFDLDGTLVDSAPDIVRALNRTLDLEGLPGVSLPGVRKLIGQGARTLVERSAALSGVSFAPERLDELTNAFIEAYSAEIALESTLAPGVEAALETCAGAGAILVVCTNKLTGLSRQLLTGLGLADRFAAIVGADAVTRRKPHPEHYREAVARAGGRLERSVMVGDSAADVSTARGAEAPVILVTFGYTDTPPDMLGADALISHFSELPAAAGRLLARR